MAAGTDFSHPLTDIEGGYSDDSSEVSVMKDVISDDSNELKQTLNGKPPRHLSVVRHSISTTPFLPPSELVSKFVLHCSPSVLSSHALLFLSGI